MDEPKCVATAIADIYQESAIASSLQRLGWRVVARAIDIVALERAQSEFPDLQIVASDDFRGIDRFSFAKLTLFRGRGEKAVDGGVAFPNADHELHLLLQSQEAEIHPASTKLSPITAKTHLISSIGRNIGTTTTAINFAAEFAANGEKVLLVDAHRAHPSIAGAFEMHGIRERTSATPFGFSIAEVGSMARIDEIANESKEFDRVIIDAGELSIDSRTAIGRRLEDHLQMWSLQSADALHLLCENRQAKLRLLKQQVEIIPTIADIQYRDLAIICDEILNRKGLDRLAQSTREYTQVPTVTYPRDNRALSLLRRDSSPLRYTAPKSTLRRAIQNHLERYSEAMKSSHR
jgi:hypothetical protein